MQEILAPLTVETTVDTVLNKSLEAPALDPIVLSVANQIIEGKSLSDISEGFNVPTDIISMIANKKEVKEYVDTVFLSQGYLNRFKRQGIIENVITAKVEEAMETQEWSKKDLLEWMKHLHDIEKETKPKEKNPVVAVQINNNYNQLMEDLMKNG